jgi:Tfp pilus assembly protein PilN
MFTQNNRHRQQLSAVSEHYEQIEAAIKKARVFMQEEEKAKEDLALLTSYLKRDLLWSDKLARLRDLVPDRVWFTKLSYEKDSLILNGNLIASAGMNLLSSLSSFINDLKGNEEFYSVFTNIILTYSSTQEEAQNLIMVFEIKLPFKKT